MKQVPLRRRYDAHMKCNQYIERIYSETIFHDDFTFIDATSHEAIIQRIQNEITIISYYIENTGDPGDETG